MPRGTNEIKTMEFTSSGVCKNALSDGLTQKDAADQLNDAFDHNATECKELDDNMIVEKGKLGRAAEIFHDYALRPVLTGGAFGATSYGVGTLINEEKAKSEKKKIKDRAVELARRDIEFELAHPRDEDGKFAEKPPAKKSKKTEKGYIGELTKHGGSLFKKASSRIGSMFKPKPPRNEVLFRQFGKRGETLARQQERAAKIKRGVKTAGKYGAAGVGSAAGYDILSGNTRRRMMPEDPYDTMS